MFYDAHTHDSLWAHTSQMQLEQPSTCSVLCHPCAASQGADGAGRVGGCGGRRRRRCRSTAFSSGQRGSSMLELKILFCKVRPPHPPTPTQPTPPHQASPHPPTNPTHSGTVYSCKQSDVFSSFFFLIARQQNLHLLLPSPPPEERSERLLHLTKPANYLLIATPKK